MTSVMWRQRLSSSFGPALLCCSALLACVACASAAERPGIEFNRDIRPILSDTCYHCHGPDAARRQAELRLDIETAAKADRDGHAAIVPGNVSASELVRRITAADPAERMPPVDSDRKLSPAQIDLLTRWIGQGAKWQKHWSLLPPERPSLPQVQQRDWIRNTIDSFVLARLEREGLSMSPEADKATLIRRLSLDLTGLPPSPAEVDAFLADESPSAYEKVVDRLLASPRYGERMAARWLDAARYADTNGYQSDGVRFMWRWRDWVIEAYNRNLPFDQFTIEQLAGDMLPGATLEQRIASGFNRNHRGNAEGGIIPEEYAVEYVVDRVDTTATVWLGLTVGCARCHDHKYDPLTQREYYQLYAYFNNVPERGKAIKFGNSPPMIPAPTRNQQRDLARLDKRLAKAERNFARLQTELADAQDAWEAEAKINPPADWNVSEHLVAHFPVDGDTRNDVSAEKSEQPPAAEANGTIAFVHGPLKQAADFGGGGYLDAGDVAKFTFYDKFSAGAWIRIEEGQGGTILSRMTDVEQGDGYSVTIEQGKVHVNLVKRWLDDAIRIESEKPVQPDRWHHVFFTYDGSRVADGIKLYIDGRPVETNVLLDDLNQSFESKEPLRIAAGNGPEHRFRGAIDDVRIYDDALSAEDVELVATSTSLAEILAMARADRTGPQSRKLARYFAKHVSPQQIRSAWQELTSLRRQRQQLVESFPTTMVMQEMPTPRETFVLLRGQYDKPGERVERGVPASLNFDQQTPRDRLELARWLVDPQNPLTARVAVNRLWQMLFGTGLVSTVDDFGSQGQWPSHPELLDWLATEFIRTGWDVKAILKTMVTSATYRQTSDVSPQLHERDPENRLLARGPRQRLSAEMIRDQALLASGLLVEKLGGPSVKPYQPPGLWTELTGGDDYVPDHGENLYRRSLYTFWKRTIAPPSMLTFDASQRETCTVRETRTNTPLQALTLLNDVTYVEAARALAQRVMLAEQKPVERITLAFRLVTARRPKPSERKILLAGYQRHLSDYRSHPPAALELLSAGESPRDDRLDTAEHAACATIAILILNLDEAITKE
jgi:hypothetical protein